MEISPIVINVAAFTVGATIPIAYYHMAIRPGWQASANEQKSAAAAAAERLKAQEQLLDQARIRAQQHEDNLRAAEASVVDLTGKLASAQARGERLVDLERQLSEKQQETTALMAKQADSAARCAQLETLLDAERKAMQEKLMLLEDAQKQLSNAFNAASAEALNRNNQAFLDLAKTTLEKYHQGATHDLDTRRKSIEETVKPIHESLRAVDSKLQELEKSRLTAYTSLTEQVKSLMSSQVGLQQETQKLVKALRAPSVGGRWGEIQLRNVVEMAGMLEYCDFLEQPTFAVEEQRLRPDMIVNLPNSRSIVVDSKAPLQAFLDAAQSVDEDERKMHLATFAGNVRSHLTKLGAKAYWEQLDHTPEFVIMFLPGEHLFSAALTEDPTLIQAGVDAKVLIATPTTLIALLRTTAYGWKQEKLAESAHAISELGRTLYERIRTMATHFADMRTHLSRTVTAYNSTIGSLESRVLVSARKFNDLGAGDGKEIPILDTCDHQVRPLQQLPSAPLIMIGSDDAACIEMDSRE